MPAQERVEAWDREHPNAKKEYAKLLLHKTLRELPNSQRALSIHLLTISDQELDAKIKELASLCEQRRKLALAAYYEYWQLVQPEWTK